MKSVAIIGTGIAGLGCAKQLHRKCALTAFEKNDYVGGHSNTAEIVEDQKVIPIDTGFMVFNTLTYPKLTRLFEELNVPSKPTDMSFGVQLHEKSNSIEWCGSSLNQLFGQRKNLFNIRFWRMILDMVEFNRLAERDYNATNIDEITIAEYVRKNGFGQDLLTLYLLPMACSLWSSQPVDIENFPAKSLLQFFHNHRLNSGLKGHLQWLTIDGGAKEYIKRLTASFKNCIKVSTPINAITNLDHSVEVQSADGRKYNFDLVIIATHADEALSLLSQPTALEKRLLSQFKYTNNSVVLHTDTRVMPKSKNCWASWNHRVDLLTHKQFNASTHYWMNNLQNLPSQKHYFISLNADKLINSDAIIKRLNYSHPTFSIESIKTQKILNSINRQNNQQRIFFCGSYFGFGFHEDALASAFDLCSLIPI